MTSKTIAAIAAACLATPAAALPPVPFYPGPAFSSADGSGLYGLHLRATPGSNVGNGVVVGNSTKYEAGLSHKGIRAVRWDDSGAPPIELPTLGTSATGVTATWAYAAHASGTVVGQATRYETIGLSTFDRGERAVRWDGPPSAMTISELPHLGTSSTGTADTIAVDINAGGTIIGWAQTFSAAGSIPQGNRAVRWDVGSTTATPLDALTFTPSGISNANAYAINTAGTIVGLAQVFVGSSDHGPRAVRWDAGGTAITLLGDIGAPTAFYKQAAAYDINSAGTVIGLTDKFELVGSTLTHRGTRPVRWDAGGTAATELGVLGTSSSGVGSGIAFAINDAGVVVGNGNKYDSFGNSLGARAIRWEAGSTVPVELGTLGTDPVGDTFSNVVAINSAGRSVGFSAKYDADGNFISYNAVLWDELGQVYDLNAFIDPASGWRLDNARGISDTNWISGLGYYDPDGAGPLAAYPRMFLMQVNELPEPASLAALALLFALPRRRMN